VDTRDGEGIVLDDYNPELPIGPSVWLSSGMAVRALAAREADPKRDGLRRSVRNCTCGFVLVGAIMLTGCGGGADQSGTTPEDVDATTEAATSGGPVTVVADGTTVRVEASGEASFLTVESDRAGHAAIRTGTCASPGDVVVDLGEFSMVLASEVGVEFADLTGGSHVLTIDSFCVGLQPK
jgi:hypothetical protein